MKKDVSVVAGIMVILTFLGISNLSNRGPESPPTATALAAKHAGTPDTAEPGGEARASLELLPCREITDRIKRFLTSDPGPIESWHLPDSCYGSGQRKSSILQPHVFSSVQFAIAMVPNPVSTHLPLMFDRIVDAIQQAAQDDNYTYDDSWFPWETASQGYIAFKDQIGAEEYRKIQQSQPGVLTFRGGLESVDSSPPYGRGLIIFLVAEKPTGGIDDDQFENALLWIQSLGGIPPQQPLRLLGPTFSGSLPSLQRILEPHLTYGQPEPGMDKFHVQISSGTVTSPLAAGWFQGRLGSRGSFTTASESDTLMVSRFCQYLDHQDYNLNRVAILSEDETAFGGAGMECHDEKRGDWAFNLYYPRDIATLRSAYEQQSIFGSEKSASNSNTPSTTLRGDLSEPVGNEHDTVRSYGGGVTPLAQESLLLQITNQLKTKEAQFIILRSTNSLDQIFLSEFLRRSYPEGRVVIDGADLLFTRGTQGKSLSGVMLLSTYPLLTQQSDWTAPLLHPLNGSYRTSGEDISEGVYIAAREVFDPQRVAKAAISDYAPPAWALNPARNPDNFRPPTWVTVIGHRQFWPLAVLNSYTLADGKVSGTLLASPDRADRDPLGPVDPKTLPFPTVIWITLIICLGWSGIHLYYCSAGSITGSTRPSAYFTPIPRWQHPALIALGTFLLVALAITVAAITGLFAWFVDAAPFLSRRTGVLLAGWVVAVVAMARWARDSNFAIKLTCAGISPTKKSHLWQKRVNLLWVMGLLVVVAVRIILVCLLTPANRLPLYWRSVNLLSGVSPLLPQLLLILGMYLWFWFNLRGMAHFGDDRPLLPKKAHLPELQKGESLMPMFSREDGGDPVEEVALPWASAKSWRDYYWVQLIIALLGTLLVGGAAFLWVEVRTLGERPFGVFISLWLCVCIAVILADASQLWRVWHELRKLLVFLDRLPLRRTLRSLQGLAWGSIWKMNGHVLAQRYRMFSLQIESLTHLKNLLEARVNAASSKDVPPSPGESAVLDAIKAMATRRETFVRWYLNLPANRHDLTTLNEVQDAMAATAGSVMKNILFPAWQTETESLIVGRSGCERSEDEGRATGVPAAAQKLPAHVRAAEEFFVLPYVAFIQNVFGRIRTIVLGIVWLFVCTTLAVSSYPFQPLNVLGGIFLTVFLLVGIVTVFVYLQMSRDATLNHITNAEPGKLGGEFWTHIITFGIGPVLGLLTTLFPSISDFIFSWLQPGTQTFK